MSPEVVKETDAEGPISVQGKKLLTIYYRHKPGGFCKRMYMLFDAWVARGGEIHNISAEVLPVTHPKVIQHIIWTPCRNKEGLFFWAYFTAVVPFYALFVALRSRIDLISVFSGFYGFLTVLIKVLLNKPLIIFARADVSEINRLHQCAKSRIVLEDFLMKCGFHLADRILSVSNHLKTVLSFRYKLDKAQIMILNNHIRLLPQDKEKKKQMRHKLGFTEADFVVISFAVLGRGKNMEVLIKAGMQLKAAAHFLVLGDGSDRARLERMTETSNTTTQFVFTGWQENVSDYLVGSDLFVLPSKSEGCSNALLEALEQGIPCLGSDVAGNREVLHHEALLFDPDDARALAQKIDTVITNRKIYENMCVLSHQARERYIFDWGKCVVRLHADFLSE